MLEIHDNPPKSMFGQLCLRPAIDVYALDSVIQEIFNEVEKNGDVAILKFTNDIDKVNLSTTIVKLNEQEAEIDSELKKAIEIAYQNIYRFHEAQKSKDISIETMPGVECIQKSIPIDRVGIYIPGGSAPLFSTVLMLAIPAQIAGCKEIVLCTPPDRNGLIHPAILYCAQLCKITEIRMVGGAQAIAAMTIGTSEIKKVDKIFGPGNQYVTAAKQLALKYGVAIDMPAGPSEVLVYADETCIPSFVAADLLAQAEHGADSQVMFVATNQSIVKAVVDQMELQIVKLPRKDVVNLSIKSSKAIVFDKIETSFEFINEYAPEHLIIASERSDDYVPFIRNAGSVFLGNYTPESAGDYASGTNHTLPTNGWAKSYSGVNLEMYCKKITYQKISKSGIAILGNTIIKMAEAENLQAHSNAVKIRIENIKNQEL